MKNTIKRILIVDDEEDICFLMKSILKKKTTAEIDTCYTVKDGKRQLEVGRYDLTFFDMRLNDGSGTELIQKAQLCNPRPYIAVISAYSSEADRARIEELEVNTFISKPLSSEKIIECLQNATK